LAVALGQMLGYRGVAALVGAACVRGYPMTTVQHLQHIGRHAAYSGERDR